jgi:mannose-6-phosphate isomerase
LTRGIVKIMLTIKESGVIDMEEKLPRKTEKPWGNELLYALTPQYAGKVISVNKGFRLSLQYHKEKDESMYLLQGKVKFSVQAPDGKMSETIGQPGYCLHLPPLTKHRVEAIEDSIILEVSTPQLSDVVRLQDDFGRAR